MKKLLVRILLGFIGGAVIGNLIVILTADADGVLCNDILIGRVGSYRLALAVQTLLSAFIGAVGMGGMSLYDVSELSLMSATVIHFVMIQSVFLPVSMFLGWINPSIFEAVVMSAIMLIAFVFIWLSLFFYYRHEARKLNSLARGHGDKQ